MLRSKPLIFLYAVLVYANSWSPYMGIFANDAGPKVDNQIKNSPFNDSYNEYITDRNCLENLSTFCINVTSYPYDEINKLLKQDYKTYFKNDPLKESDRNKNDEYTNMCDTITQYITPQRGITADNIEKLIINLGTNYAQGIRFTTCAENKTCNDVDDAKNYKSYCKQHYTYEPLLSVDVSLTKVSIELFKIPSGCCCAARRLPSENGLFNA